jgi:hypothetical protein
LNKAEWSVEVYNIFMKKNMGQWVSDNLLKIVGIVLIILAVISALQLFFSFTVLDLLNDEILRTILLSSLCFRFVVEIYIWRRKYEGYFVKRPTISLFGTPTEAAPFQYVSELDGSVSGMGTASLPYYRSELLATHPSSDAYEPHEEGLKFVFCEFGIKTIPQKEIDDAIGVWAEIDFFNKEGDVIYKGIQGRWADKSDVLVNPYLVKDPQTELKMIDIPANGISRKLCVAMKNPNEDPCYYYNWSTYISGKYKSPDHVLNDYNMLVRVKLRGKNIDDHTFDFLLKNHFSNLILEKE